MGEITALFCAPLFGLPISLLAIRLRQESIFSLGLFSNKAMLGAVLLTMGLHLFIIYMLFCNELFSTTPLTVAELGIAVAVVSVVFWVVEAQKLVSRRYAGPI